MSAVADAVKVLTSQSDVAAKEVQGQLEMLMALAEAKNAQQIAFIDERVAKAAENKEIVPAIKMMDQTDVRVVSSSGPAQGITDAVSLLLKNAQANWQTAVGDLINVALNSLLGQASGSQQDMVLYLVALDGKPESSPGAGDNSLAPVRIDYCLWSYNISESSVVDTASAAVAYTARKYIVDLTAIPDDLTLRFVLQDIGTPNALIDQWIQEVDKLKQNPEGLHNYVNQELPPEQQSEARAQLRLS